MAWWFWTWGKEPGSGQYTRVYASIINYDLALGNSFFKKKEEHYVTYMSGTNRAVIDYILVRRQDLRDLKDCKVIPGESIASQHRLLVASVEFKAYHKRQQRARVRKINWYMLKQQEKKDELAQRLAEHYGKKKIEGRNHVGRHLPHD